MSTALDINEILADLRGFGIEETEGILTIPFSKGDLRIKLENIPTETEIASHIAIDGGVRNYAWMQQVKAEVLSRSISWANGYDFKEAREQDLYVVDPTDSEGVKRPVQVILRKLILGWGQEVMQVLWKVLMVHSQGIEDRLIAALPQAAVRTEVERRYFEMAAQSIEDEAVAVIQDVLEDAVSQEDES